MNKLKEDIIMQTQIDTTKMPALPKVEEKSLMQAEINQELYEAVTKEIKRKNLKIRSVMEWGMRAFLLVSNPKEAAKLGIK